MDAMTLNATPSLTLDVVSDETMSLRRRLQETSIAATSLLPGGVMFEDGATALSYHFSTTAGWTVGERDGELLLSHPDGHRLSVRNGHMHLAIAK